MDKSGYNPSILQSDTKRCYLCGRTSGKLDRHEVFGASNRKRSKAMGLWVVLCHRPCHLELAHGDGEIADLLHRRGQTAAMNVYHMSKEDFIEEMGRSYL